MQTSLCEGGMLKYSCLHVQDAWVEVVHVVTSLARTVNKLKGGQRRLKTNTRMSKEQL